MTKIWATVWILGVRHGIVSAMVEELADVQIRAAEPGDAEQVAKVHVASWRQAYTGVISDEYLARLDVDARIERWRRILEDEPETKVWVADDDGRVIGFASLGPSRDEDADRTTMEIYTIYLEPSVWGQGVARDLMRTVLAAVPAGASVTLWVLAANERARHFYRRNGFAPDGVERVEEFDGETFTEVRYRRD